MFPTSGPTFWYEPWKKSFGTARMVKEGGAYKVAAEAWRN